MKAPTGRKPSVTVIERATAELSTPKSCAMRGSATTTRKKSKASSVQPRKLATSALT